MRHFLVPTTRRSLALTLALLAACSGDLGSGASATLDGPSGPDGPGQPNAGQPAERPGDGDGPGGGDGDGFIAEDPQNPSDSACTPGEAQPGTRVVRLTHAQYDHTVQDLLGLDVTPADQFLTDATFAGFDNSAEGLVVPDRLARDYRRAAEALAGQAVDDPQARQRIIVCDPNAAGCAKTTIEQLGRRAFRRPLTDAETTGYLALHARGSELVGERDPFSDGLQLVLEAMLQSPKFLYRVELSQDAGQNGFIRLSGYELATRLSYMLWNTMPDDALLDAAEAGQLDTPDGVATEAARMLQAPEARRVLDDFARQWLDFARYEDLTKDPNQFPDFRASISGAMAEEVRLFMRDLVFDQQAGFAELYTSPTTFVDDTLAPYYGLPATGRTGFEKVDLDPAERGGLLTQVGFLASHAFTDRSSPIHRGVFIHRRILCTNLPDPPGNVDLNLPPIEGEIKTTRQQVEVHTSPAACTGCHGIINPAGFAFEHFDAIGGFRDMDHGEAIDTSGTLVVDGQEVSFDDHLDFTRQVSESSAARRCFATQYMRYAYGRREGDGDRCTLDYLADQLGQDGYSLQDMMLDLTRTRAFMQRKAEVTP